MNALQALMDATIRTINEHPAEITIHRLEYQNDDSGGRDTQESDLAPFTARLVPSRQDRQIRLQDEAGKMQLSGWILIAPWDADIKHGSNVEDAFTAAGVKYRVLRVIPRKINGDTYAIHAVVEEVS